MAWALRAGASKLRIDTGLCKIASKNNVPKIHVSWISNIETRKSRPPRPKPFPYKEKWFSFYHQLFDDTLFRFDDNTKLIVVEGPPAVGKGELCKKLAHEFDMLYVPQSVPEDYYVHRYNFDLRTLDDKLPESFKSTDLDAFLKNPNIRNGGGLQFLFYQLKYLKFRDILCHILSTGQGVVTERSPWSDACFAKAMHSNGYISSNAFELYNIMVSQTLHDLMRPHLVVYLDAPVKTVREKIKARNIPCESKVFHEKFLTDLESNNKFEFLKRIDEHAHILIYDYSCGGDFEVIAEDIEELNFDVDRNSTKMEDWNLHTCLKWTSQRLFYQCQDARKYQNLQVEQLTADELVVTAEDVAKRYEVLKKYAPPKTWNSFLTNTEYPETRWV